MPRERRKTKNLKLNTFSAKGSSYGAGNGSYGQGNYGGGTETDAKGARKIYKIGDGKSKNVRVRRKV